MIEDRQISNVAEDPFGFIQYAMFLAALYAWGTANWYGSRVLGVGGMLWIVRTVYVIDVHASMVYGEIK